MPTSTCYWDWPKSNELSNLVPCGDTGSSIQKCCVRGDLCLSDSICHFTHPLVNASGYYNSGCTDETYSDPQACSKHCSDTLYPDIVYNRTSGLWACCAATPSSTFMDCSDPSDETFQATPLDQLKIISGSSALSLPTILSSTSTSFFSSYPPTTSATTTDTASIVTVTQVDSSTSQPTNKNDASLGSSAKAGIIIGAFIAAVSIFALIVFLVRRSRHRKPVLDGPSQAADQSEYIFTGGKTELDSRVRAELDSRSQAELYAGNNRVELQ